MEVRARSGSAMDSRGESSSCPASEDTSKSRRTLCGRFLREFKEIGRVTLRMFKGQGSTLSYLFIPALISILWLVLCLLTTKSPSMSLEERLSQKYLRVNIYIYVFYLLNDFFFT